MPGRDTESVGGTGRVVSEAAHRRAVDVSSAALAQSARAGRLAPTDLLRLQRMVGNRAVGRIAAAYERRLQRDSPEERPMLEKGGKTDQPVALPEGNSLVWDGFDGTLTIYTSLSGPNQGKAYQLTYKEGSIEELQKRNAQEIIEHVEVLSPLRAAALEWLRKVQGTYQETEAQRKTRVDTAVDRLTLCNQHTGKLATVVSAGKEQMGRLDPREGAIKGRRAGAFHTLESHPKGPRPGDIVSYGKVLPAPKPGALRQANFLTVLHIGVFKSRRTMGGKEVWTVVDGGQGKFEGRQETRERTRTFTKERLDIQVPKTLYEEGPKKGWIKEEDKREVMECGVLKSKLADAGQSADDKLLRGWLDIDEYFGGGSAPAETTAGVMHRVFVGTKKAAELSVTKP